MRPCMKQVVQAMARVDGRWYIGENLIADDAPAECPRKDAATGTGYEKCTRLCRQTGHAEQMLVEQVPNRDLKGAHVYVYGHTYACGACMAALERANAGAVLFPDGVQGES